MKEYVSVTMEKYFTMITKQFFPVAGKKTKKINADIVVTPKFNESDLLFIYNYNQNQLKQFAKEYKLKISGNKKELLDRLYSYLKLSSFVVKIQKLFRGQLSRKMNSYRGPAWRKRELCTNDTDFLTCENIRDISPYQFFSFQDTDKFIYGFDIVSLHNLITKSTSGKTVKNPYNRGNIPTEALIRMKHLIRLSKILKIPVVTEIQDISQEVTNQKSLELRILDLFQNIDALGNYSNSQWFISLHRAALLKFIRELSDIWDYRAQLTPEIKRTICPPDGRPFRNLQGSQLFQEQNIDTIRKSILEVLEKMVNSGIDQDSRSIGAYYVLAALTLVSENAATALPWLFQSVS